MKKKAILLTVVILFTLGALAQAQEGKLSATFEVTYLSRYIWRGFDVYEDNHSALQLGTNVNLYDTGFGLSIVNTRANSSGDGLLGMPNQDLERIDFTLYYNNNFFEGETYATNYTLGWVYYNWPDSSNNYADLQEFFASLSWPNLPLAGVVPSYTIVRMWPSKSDSDLNSALSALGRGDAGGWIHVFGLGYDLTVPELTPEIPEQVLHLSADFAYNDGVLGADHDWSHAVFGVSTEIDLGNNLTFCPGLYHQASMEDSVNESDETWFSLSLKYNF